MFREVLFTVLVFLVPSGEAIAETTSDPLNLIGVLDVSARFDGDLDPILGAPKDWLAATWGDESVPKNFTVKEHFESQDSLRTTFFISDFLLIETDYEQAHIVVFEKAGDWLQVLANGETLWLQMESQDKFYAYPDLLRDGLNFLTNSKISYSQRPAGTLIEIALSPAMQGSLEDAKYWTPAVEVIEVQTTLAGNDIGSEEIRNSLLKVRMTNRPHCAKPSLEPETIIFEGWISAYQRNGTASVWFHSRGC